MPARFSRKERRDSDEGELPVPREAGAADADEPERAGPIGQSAVEEAAGELADPSAVVDPDAERRRAAPDREVGGAELRRDGPRRLAVPGQVLGDAVGHPHQLAVEPVAVGEVALEGLLDA